MNEKRELYPPRLRLIGLMDRAVNYLRKNGIRKAIKHALDSLSLRTRPRSVVRYRDVALGIERRRVCPSAPFVGWILSGDDDDGFSRAGCLLFHEELCQLGTNSVILRTSRPAWTPLNLKRKDIEYVVRTGFDVVVFHQVERSESAAQLVEALRRTGTKTVYASGDPNISGMPEIVDDVVVAGEELRMVAPGREVAAEVIELAIDAPSSLVKDYSRRPIRENIRVVWVGYPENIHLLNPVREALLSPRLKRYQLVTISRGRGVTYQWNRKQVHRQLLDCDIAVLPSKSTLWYMAKPNTRMTMMKSLGLPIVASPIPAYTSLLKHGESCYFAYGLNDWIDALERLGDFEHRMAIGLADREHIVHIYGTEAIARRWHACFQRLLSDRSPS